jgi:flavodoxin I
MSQVIYFSRSGNTKKVAEVIADEINVKATDVKETTLESGTDIVFLGSGNYGGKPSPKMIEFIKQYEFKNRNVALFGTSGGGIGKELNIMENLLTKKDAKVLGRFSCKGKTFFLFNRGRPDENDLDEAMSFAQKMVKKG